MALWNKALELSDYDRLAREVRLFERLQTEHGYWMLLSVLHRRWEYAMVYRCIRRFVSSGARCLEIGASAGAGQGTPLAPALALEGYTLTVTDMNDNARIACEEQNRRLGTSLVFQREDATALTCSDQSFDCVYSISVIEHVPDDVGALREAMRVLRPGGLFVFTCDFMSESRTAGFGQLRFYTREDLEQRVFPTLRAVGGQPVERPDYSAHELNVLWAGARFNFACVAVLKS